jgi:hypothetical protein
MGAISLKVYQIKLAEVLHYDMEVSMISPKKNVNKFTYDSRRKQN